MAKDTRHTYDAKAKTVALEMATSHHKDEDTGKLVGRTKHKVTFNFDPAVNVVPEGFTSFDEWVLYQAARQCTVDVQGAIRRSFTEAKDMVEWIKGEGAGYTVPATQCGKAIESEAEKLRKLKAAVATMTPEQKEALRKELGG